MPDARRPHFLNKGRLNRTSGRARSGLPHTSIYLWESNIQHPIDNRVSVGGDLVQVDFDIIDIGEIVEVDPGISGKGSRTRYPCSSGLGKYEIALPHSTSRLHRIAGTPQISNSLLSMIPLYQDRAPSTN